MFSSFDPYGEHLRKEIRRFTRKSSQRISRILTHCQETRKFLTRTAQVQGEKIAEGLRQLEEASRAPHAEHLAQLSRYSWKLRKQMDQWLHSLPFSLETRKEGEAKRVESSPITWEAVPVGKHSLPPLSYSYDALEPYIDEKTMVLHHDILHKKYVEGLNKAETELAMARRTGNFDLVKHWERETAFNGAGHYLHTIFWSIMTPQGGGQPAGDLLHQIEGYFGNFTNFKKQFTAAAEKVEGGGWAILVWSPRARHLEILQAEKHQNLSQWDAIPLLTLDVWEHAYYLKYNTRRKEYIDAWWNVVNWKEVEYRFTVATQVAWIPY